MTKTARRRWVSELRACPFCGTANTEEVPTIVYVHERDGSFFGTCDYCGSRGPRTQHSQHAREAWNERKQAQAPFKNGARR